MRHLLFVFVFASAITFSSCSKNEAPDVVSEDGIITLTREIVFELPATRTGPAATIEGSLTATFDPVVEKVLTYSISGEILDILELTAGEFDELMREQYGDDYMDPNSMLLSPDGTTGSTETWRHSDCIDKCNKQFTDENGKKKDGRGKCKFNCWVDTMLEVMRAAAEIASGFGKFL